MEKVRQRVELDARAHGYRLNSDPEFLRALIEGLGVNEERYGYPSCPCRIAAGIFEMDRDIICPCDYHDPDVEEFGACYCCLYVDDATYESGEIRPVPERRPQEKQSRPLRRLQPGLTGTKPPRFAGPRTEPLPRWRESADEWRMPGGEAFPA